MPKHVFDSALREKGWTRLEFSRLPTAESDKVAGRMITLSPVLAAGDRRTLAMIDVHIWRQGELVRFDLAMANRIPAMLQVLVVQGLEGVSPIALGLTPCNCRGPKWNPLVMPLVWQQSMNNQALFTQYMMRYSNLVKTDKRWQCTDMRHLA